MKLSILWRFWVLPPVDRLCIRKPTRWHHCYGLSNFCHHAPEKHNSDYLTFFLSIHFIWIKKIGLTNYTHSFLLYEVKKSLHLLKLCKNVLYLVRSVTGTTENMTGNPSIHFHMIEFSVSFLIKIYGNHQWESVKISITDINLTYDG